MQRGCCYLSPLSSSPLLWSERLKSQQQPFVTATVRTVSTSQQGRVNTRERSGCTCYYSATERKKLWLVCISSNQSQSSQPACRNSNMQTEVRRKMPAEVFAYWQADIYRRHLVSQTATTMHEVETKQSRAHDLFWNGLNGIQL